MNAQEKRLFEHWKPAALKQLADGSILLVYPYAFTWGLCYDVCELSYGGRFCFNTLQDALGAFQDYQGATLEMPEAAIRVKGKFKGGGDYWPEDHQVCLELAEAKRKEQ